MIPDDNTTIQLLDTVAMFKQNSKEWKICKSYPRPVIQPTLVFQNNRVYAFGGRELKPNKKWSSTRRVQVIDVSEFSGMDQDQMTFYGKKIKGQKMLNVVHLLLYHIIHFKIKGGDTVRSG